MGRHKIVHLNGNGRIEKVSAESFCERFHGKNPAFTIFCPTDVHGRALGDKNGCRICSELRGTGGEL